MEVEELEVPIEENADQRKKPKLKKKPSKPVLSWKPTSPELLADAEQRMLASTSKYFAI